MAHFGIQLSGDSGIKYFKFVSGFYRQDPEFGVAYISEWGRSSSRIWQYSLTAEVVLRGSEAQKSILA